jgi:Na+/melibiose symporter-like transporter
MWLANTNAAIWAVGNGLVSTTLVTFLAMDLGATGLAVSLILAAPRLVGVLRIVAPAMMTTGSQRKLVCLAGYLSSAVVLGVMALFGRYHIAGLVACWCLYHLLEYIATVALWSWLGDWMPPSIRGRLIGWRERYLVIGRIVGIGASVAIALLWAHYDLNSPRWLPLAWSAGAGAMLMALAALPLFALAPRSSATPPRSRVLWEDLVRALTDPAYRKLIVYSCWFAVANAVSGPALGLYPNRVLDLRYADLAVLRSLMHAGQAALAPACGAWIDLGHTRWLITISQLIVATGPLFYMIATPDQRWWIVGAYVVWIAYAPINVGLDTLKLRLVPTATTAPALAVYHAMGDLANGVTLVVAGAVFDAVSPTTGATPTIYAAFFLVGWLLRTSAAWLAWRVPEMSPNADGNAPK